MGKMTNDQIKLFRQLYNFIHDEAMQCQNLIGVIEFEFPDPEQDEISQMLNDVVTKYLMYRHNTGDTVMQLMYSLEAIIREQENGGDDEY